MPRLMLTPSSSFMAASFLVSASALSGLSRHHSTPGHAKSRSNDISGSLGPGDASTVVPLPADRHNPLPSTPIQTRHPTTSAESLRPGTDAVPRPKFTYPRFSMVTTLANTGGPGFSIEELTSTEVSEDEDAIMHESCLRRRTLPRLSWQPSTLPTVPSESGSQLPSDRLQKTADYVRHILASLLQALMAYLRTADKPRTEAGAQHASPPQPCDTPAETYAHSI
ncbi:hypothetical protein DV736_g720, partial [Chaetothyriales sp. CBS 134916]